ncbi:MAG: formate C-acetyltransferase/glycerol dehydratase family glycyl radical enzyme [Bacteroidia bacterium]|nr:formate C-acetyltransferase/glycerol dehydratase family glycyl radical enzyme [Bacteroidia bacterium]
MDKNKKNLHLNIVSPRKKIKQKKESVEKNNTELDQLRKKVLSKLRMPEVCVERIKLITESYKETEGQPMIIRRAKAFRKILNEIPITIENWQLIVGNFASEPFKTSIYPEYAADWILEEIDTLSTRPGDKFILSEENKKILSKIIPYWKGKTVEELTNNITPETVKNAERNYLIASPLKNAGLGQFLPNFKKILQKGFMGIKEEGLKRKEHLDTKDKDFIRQSLFYEAALICCEAVVEYARRHSRLAKELAVKEQNEYRRNDLLKISEICEKVPAQPAKTFLEALQSFWLTHILASISAAGQGITVGRLDQFMYPYYKKDIDDRKLTREEAKRWLTSCWINFNQILTFYRKKTAHLYAGYPIAQEPEIGGLNEKGQDATNDLSELILEVEASLNLHQPDIAVIYHSKMKDDFLLKACKLIPGAGKPKFFNNDVAIQQLVRKGATREEAKNDIGFVGCVESALSGKSYGPFNWGFLSLPKCLELALNDGRNPVTGEQVGVLTGNPERFKTFNQFKNAVKKQIAYGVKQHIILNDAMEIAHSQLVPLPYESLLVDGCVEKGIDLTSGGAYLNMPAFEGIGLGTVADSLMAVKKLVYEEKSVKLKELLEALKSNFKDKEILRQTLINGAPKYGNDIDEVDLLAQEIADCFRNEVEKYQSPRGVHYCAGLYSLSAHAAMGGGLGATPDGRKAGEPFSDGLSPAQGVCKTGPTAVIKSVCKIDHSAMTNGTLLNMKFHTMIMNNTEKLEKFVALLRTFMKLGGFHVQFNVINTETLRDAQKNPERYPELIVRVAAYVALFTQLPKELQDDIINRSELTL